MQIVDSGIIRLMTAPIEMVGFDPEDTDSPKSFARVIVSPPSREEPLNLHIIRYRSEVCLVSSDWLTTGSAFVELNVEDEIGANDGTLPNRQYTKLCEKYLDSTIPLLMSLFAQSFGTLKGLLKGKGNDIDDALPKIEVTMPAPEVPE